MHPTAQLAHDFLTAAQALGDRMLSELTARDPVLTQAVAFAVEHGESLSLCFTLGDKPAIELITQTDYRTVRRVASIPLQARPQGRAS